MSLILGLDIGGTGSRAALGEFGDVSDQRGNVAGGTHAAAGAGSVAPVVDQIDGPRITIGQSGSTVLDVIRELVKSAADTWSERFSEVAGIGIGATGIASFAEDPAEVLAKISSEHGVPAVAAIDAVTAHLGALGGTGGAITVLGTGAIAIAHSGPDDAGHWSAEWSRADGWGHLFGDRGGGAWLGHHALELALRTHTTESTNEVVRCLRRQPHDSARPPPGRDSSIPAATGQDCSPNSSSTSPRLLEPATQHRPTCSAKLVRKRPAARSPQLVPCELTLTRQR